ncbi:hypothetical protein LIHA111178_05200 [Litorimonas haliclonae]
MTGGSGFIGRHFLNDYAHEFSRIVLPLRSAPDFELPSHVEVKMVTGKPEEVSSLLKNEPCDYVLNAAGYGVKPNDRDASQMKLVNIDLPTQLAKAANIVQSKRFVQLGSMSEYLANGTDIATRETDTVVRNTNSYGGSKAEATQQLRKVSESEETEITCLRLFGVFGEGEAPHRLLPSLQSKLSAGETVPMSEGTQIRDFIYIPDVTSAIFAALTQPERARFTVYNIGSGRGISVREFSKVFCRLGKYRPEQLNFGSLPMRDTDVSFMVANIEKANTFLDWRPEWTTETALADYLSKFH